MAVTNVVQARLVLYNGPSTAWSEKNPTPLKGELVAETDTGLLKLGDGTSTFNELQYINVPPALLQEKLNKKIDKPSTYVMGNIAGFAADGALIDLGVNPSEMSIGIATEITVGGVTSSRDDNAIKVNEETGKMTLNRVAVNNLFVPNGDELVIFGGTATN